MNRRKFLHSATALSAASLTGSAAPSQGGSVAAAAADPAYRIRHGRLKQTVMGWCFRPMDAVTLARHARDIGLVGIEGVDTSAYPEIRALGLNISLVGSHSFNRGPCNPEFRAEVVAKLTEAIEMAAAVGCRKVITFTGMKFPGIDHDRAVRDCLDIWKQVLPLAERKGITLCLEHLNSRDGSQPMRGHPGYFGDDVDFCIDLVKQIGSPNFRLLFDIYHVQIMNGDVIRRIRDNQEWIAHYHTAGNPGRVELDEKQEIYYPAVVRAIVETGYDDYLAQQFIPTWEDPILALRHAAMVCDV